MPRSNPSIRLIGRLRSVLTLLLERVVIGITLTLAVVVVAGVASRKAGYSLVWYDEVAALLLAWLTYYGAGLAALQRAHLGLPNLVQAAPPRVARALFLVREAMVIGFFSLVAWMGWNLLAALGGTTLVSLPWLPSSVVYSAVPIGAGLFIVAELCACAESWAEASAE